MPDRAQIISSTEGTLLCSCAVLRAALRIDTLQCAYCTQRRHAELDQHFQKAVAAAEKTGRKIAVFVLALFLALFVVGFRIALRHQADPPNGGDSSHAK